MVTHQPLSLQFTFGLGKFILSQCLPLSLNKILIYFTMIITLICYIGLQIKNMDYLESFIFIASIAIIKNCCTVISEKLLIDKISNKSTFVLMYNCFFILIFMDTFIALQLNSGNLKIQIDFNFFELITIFFVSAHIISEISWFKIFSELSNNHLIDSFLSVLSLICFLISDQIVQRKEDSVTQCLCIIVWIVVICASLLHKENKRFQKKSFDDFNNQTYKQLDTYNSNLDNELNHTPHTQKSSEMKNLYIDQDDQIKMVNR